MSKYDLSILIPARNEVFISNTVKDILKNKRGRTQIIVGMDGEWSPGDGVPDHQDVIIVKSPESWGQRGMTNQLARLSDAKYVAKCDAHCVFDEGFDVKLMKAMEGHDDWTIVPTMCNLHAFDWVCGKCGERTYQGPTPGTDRGLVECARCSNRDYSTFTKDILFKVKERTPHSTAFLFDSEPHFQYFNEFKRRPEGGGDITPTMSLQGSFFMMTREKYWSLNICDESFPSWGSQGIEVAVKTWLSGGRVMCLQTTWYAHMFRTQGGDFGFPYQMPGRMAGTAKKKARELFYGGKFPGQIHPLSWLIEKFYPVPGWSDDDIAQLKRLEGASKGIIYYTDNQLRVKIAKRVQKQLRSIGLPIVSASLKPMDNMGKNVVINGERGYHAMFRQIIAALENSTVEIVFFCEHDVLYHPSHFDFTPPEKDKFYYNQNWWKVWDDGLVAHWNANQVSGLCCYRGHALDFYRKRLAEIETEGFNRSYEPGGRDKSLYDVWNSPFSNIDIRHDNNLTNSHRSIDEFRDKSTAEGFSTTTLDKIQGWSDLESII